MFIQYSLRDRAGANPEGQLWWFTIHTGPYVVLQAGGRSFPGVMSPLRTPLSGGNAAAWSGSIQAGEHKTPPSNKEDTADFECSTRSQMPIIGVIV